LWAFTTAKYQWNLAMLIGKKTCKKKN